MTKAPVRLGSSPRLKVGPQASERLEARLELDARQRRADADVDTAAEADVLHRVLARNVELVGTVEHARVAVRRTEEQGDLRSPRDRYAAEREVVRQHPALEQLQRRVEADHLFTGGGRRHRAVDDAPPLIGVPGECRASRFRAC